jgi:hypothetical protein
MCRINEVAVEQVRQHGAPTLSPHYNFFVTNSQGVSFFIYFFLCFSLFLMILCSYLYSQFIGTIKLFALVHTCNWLVMLEKVKVVPHL